MSKQFSRRSLRHRLRSAFHRNFVAHFPRSVSSDNKPVSLLIPLAEKDLNLIRISLPQILKQLNHPVERCFLVSPPSPEIRKFADEHSVELLIEDEILPSEVSECEAKLPPGFRRGWLRQQLIKLSFPLWTNSQRMVVFDADTFPVRPLPFWTGEGKPILYSSDEYNPDYAAMNHRLIPEMPRYPYSFVAHQMGFEARTLTELHETLEKLHQCSWIGAIYRHLVPNTRACFSEYELYGNFSLSFTASSPEVRYWFNQKVSLGNFEPNFALHRSARFNSISSHQPTQ